MALWKALVYMILGFSYNVVDVVNVLCFIWLLFLTPQLNLSLEIVKSHWIESNQIFLIFEKSLET